MCTVVSCAQRGTTGTGEREDKKLRVHSGGDNDTWKRRAHYRTRLEVRTRGRLRHVKALRRKGRLLDFTGCGEFRTGRKEATESSVGKMGKSEPGEKLRISHVCFPVKIHSRENDFCQGKFQCATVFQEFVMIILNQAPAIR